MEATKDVLVMKMLEGIRTSEVVTDVMTVDEILITMTEGVMTVRIATETAESTDTGTRETVLMITEIEGGMTIITGKRETTI